MMHKGMFCHKKSEWRIVEMGIKIGLVGLGTFGTIFAPLFAGHPLVDSVSLCDAEADRIAETAAIPAVARKLVNSQCTQNFDEICKSDCDALVIMTQPWEISSAPRVPLTHWAS